MKNLIISLLVIGLSLSLQAQESLIASIMNVDPVNLTIGEEDQQKVIEYDASVAENRTKLDEELAELGTGYAESVTKLIQKFSESMSKGDEKSIKNEKQRVETQTNALTFNLIKEKKAAIQRFKNAQGTLIRSLPRPIAKIKQKELSEVGDEYKEAIHTEFEANQRVLRAFKATEHVTKTHVTETDISN